MATILLVDDEELVRSFLRLSLEGLKHRLLEAKNGQEALKIACEQAPDLILTDIAMPTMDGYELFYQLSLDPATARIPVIFFTGVYERQEVQSLTRAHNSLQILPKPSPPEMIQGAVEVALKVAPVVEISEHEFDRQHLRLVTDKLSKKIADLEREMHDRQRAELALRETETRFRNLAEGALDAIITFNEAAEVIFANHAAEKVFGYEVNELIGKSITILMPEYLIEDFQEGFRSYLETQAETISLENLTLNGLHRQGHEVPLELSFSEYVNDGQRFFTGIVRDVTERKRAEEELRKSEEYFRSLIENTSDIITILDADCTIKYESPSVERILGYMPSEMVCKNLLSFIHPDDLIKLQTSHKSNHLGSGKLLEFRCRHRDGSWRTLEVIGNQCGGDTIIVNS
ncbi:MAG TPA: PAS domain S-box protein, partial [Blastocatellia bacterium]|nr:PAS domain S-box protein [Blastocatellia bacterium]